VRLPLLAVAALAALTGRASADDGRVWRCSETLDKPIQANVERFFPDETDPWCGAGVPGAPPTAPPPQAATDPCAAALTTARGTGYRLSVDGRVLSGDGRTSVESQRCQDVRLAAAGIRVQSDERGVRKNLALDAWPDRAWAGEPVTFSGYWNYSHWVHLSEVRLFPAGGSTKMPPAEVIELGTDGHATWTPPKPGAWTMVLRVYDAGGRFDETEPYDLKVSSGSHKASPPLPPDRELAVSFGKNHIALDRIRVSGALVTVSADGIKPGNYITALGRAVPLSKDGRFAVEEILPPGRHEVSVRVDGPEPLDFTRSIYVAQDHWFYVAMADLTVGGNKAPQNAAVVTQDSDHYARTVYADGRAAFYLKGQVKGDWILTASADTREQPVNTLFTTLDEKDPKYLLRRIDPNLYYPVYGDDSTLTEDAPTSGKFFVRLERGESRVMWGNYAVRLRGNELATVDRALYGADARLVSDSVTTFGERKRSLEAFAGDPGTLHAREDFRGTGGSLFYLQHLDLTAGSDLVSVEIRDKDSGIVVRTNDLARGQDYDIDPLQGRIVLSQPLPSTADDSQIVRSADLSGDPVYLVVRYEYEPGLTQIGTYSVGGRASSWLGDHVEVGATGSQDPDGLGGQSKLGGADATVRYTPATYLKGEVARTEGPGTGAQSSADGGFTFNPVAQATPGRADAARLEGAASFADLHRDWDGRATGYWKAREAGFAGPGQLTTAETEQFGGTLSKTLPGRVSLDAKYDQSQTPGATRTQTLDVNLRKPWGEHWATSLGARTDWRNDVTPSSSVVLSQNGQLTTVAGQLSYDSKGRWSAYGFGQGTTEDTGTRLNNTRGGVGGKLALNNRWSVNSEVSGGQGHAAGKVGTEARVNDRTTLYTTYEMEGDRTDQAILGGNGTLVSGAKTRYTDSTTIFGEERWQHGSGPTSLTHAYGLDIAEQDGWHWGLSGEQGTVVNPGTPDLQRFAATGSVGVTRKGVKWASALEYRDDEGNGSQRTWLTRNSLGYQVHPDWRALAKLSYSISNSGQGTFYTGQYTEGVIGAAYRPVENDRLNALFKYTYFTDLASPGQLTATAVTPDYSQRSHIVSADATYDLIPKLSIGGKYALRLSQVRLSRDDSSPWFSSTAHLAVVRLDFHVVRHWDAVLEGRDLIVVEAKDSRIGALLAIYRQLGKNMKLGGGYNFTDYSDELTDLSYRSHGWFVNALANF
jgi:hypothetical protein